MPHWSTGRGQTEPFAAIVAVFAVVVGVVAYGGVLAGILPATERNVAKPTQERVRAAISDGGVVKPAALQSGLEAGPDGYQLNLTLTVDDHVWQHGPTSPPDADVATRTVNVRVGPGRVRPGQLRVEVWR